MQSGWIPWPRCVYVWEKHDGVYIGGESPWRITGTVDGGTLGGQELEDGKRENLTFPSVSFLFHVKFSNQYTCITFNFLCQ